MHCLRTYELAVCRHGENLILVLRDGVVRRALMKDIGEEVAMLGDRPLRRPSPSASVGRNDDEKALAVLEDVFDGVLRHLSGILAEDGVLGEDRFWAPVAETINEQRHRAPGPRWHRHRTRARRRPAGGALRATRA